MQILSFQQFINENFNNFRNLTSKIELDNVNYAFHWLTEGNLFTQVYHEDSSNTNPYILRKFKGKKLEMPPLPKTKYILGGEGDGVCLTIDPGYENAGVSGEANICLVFSMDELKKFKIQNLTDNGEAEIRIQTIPNFNKIIKAILIPNKDYNKGDGWEGFFYRAVSEWLPDELKRIVHVLPSTKAISKELAKTYQ